MAYGATLRQITCGQKGCQHSGYYTGIGVYSRHSRTLRYLLVCEDCGKEMKEISSLEYAPDPVFAAS
jgi:hypothetical protein